MRLALIAYFDLGKSFDLGDNVFPQSQLAPEADIGLVGIRNPLGRGLLLDLVESSPRDVVRWREAALRQLSRSESETGWSAELGIPKDVFVDRLSDNLINHPIKYCDLTIFAIGIVFVRLELEAGLPLEYITGVSRCFEYAAYSVEIGSTLHSAAQKRVAEALGHKPNSLEALSKRQLPAPVRDARDYEEQLFITSFTDLILCTDMGDEADIGQALQILGIQEVAPTGGGGALASGKAADQAIRYEYHGWLHYSWPACLLQPNGWDDADYTATSQIARMFECIKIAHVFLGTLEAFERLFQDEIRAQVGGYVRGVVGGRDPSELNRLRTLALAVVNLTNFKLVTPTDEDQAYFRRFNEDAHIDQRQESITNACETLYNVQVAEIQEENTRRQNLLNVLVFLVGLLALISVSADAYNFVREEKTIFEDMFLRIQLLIEFFVAISIMAALAVIVIRPENYQISNAMGTLLAKNWWMLLLRAIFNVLFGLTILLLPRLNITSLLTLFAIFVIVDGIFAIVAGTWTVNQNERLTPLILEGSTGIVTGAVALLWPEITIAIFVYLLVVWAIFSGAFLIGAAFRLDVAHGRRWVILGAVSSILWGEALFITPITGVLVLSWWLSTYALVFGALLIVLVARLKRRYRILTAMSTIAR